MRALQQTGKTALTDLPLSLAADLILKHGGLLIRLVAARQMDKGVLAI